KMTKNIWVILTLILIIEYSDGSFYDEMSCANCSGVNEECNVTTTGWSCDFEHDAHLLIDNGDSSEIPNSLAKCMPPGMAFKEKQVLYGYCCFWSPQLGCQKLMRKDDKEDLCFKCTREVWSPLMEDASLCPCGNNWYRHRESSKIRLKPWNFLFIYQGMLIIIINL
ncbi:hypothetical protein KR032_003691, partial [Drosophila birchii]